MPHLNQTEPACVSEHKEDGLCENCARDLSILKAVGYELTTEFTPKRVKNLRTKIHFKCDGFIERG